MFRTIVTEGEGRHGVESVLVHAWLGDTKSRKEAEQSGGDDRGGPVGPRSMAAESSHTPARRC